MIVPSRRAFMSMAASALLAAAASAVAARAMAQSPSLVGTYDGGQMEMAAALELLADGRFRYALAYGALDEQAAGKWSLRGDRVLLTSDPVRAPRFVLVSQGKGAPGVLRIDLDVPKGVSRQYFDAVIAKANGQSERKQLAEDGLLLSFAAAEAPTTIRLLLQMIEVASGPVRVDANSGYSVRFRFEPNDVGKVSFQATPLKVVNGALLLDRHGRTIRFRRTGQ
jgi:opacity protein-like surface antigen